jgi:predicted TIM-barrel fold metal-dependent hydrolase
MARELPYCFPPHPSPRKPNFKLPPGTVDAHFHIFGPPELFPWSPPETRVYTPPAAPYAHYRMLADHLGIDRGVVVQPMAHGHDNSVTLDAIARSQGRFRGVAKVDDRFDANDLRQLHAGGIRGVRFNMIEESGGAVDLSHFERVVARIAPLGWSITFHVKPGELVEHADWFRKLPIPTIIDHYGRVEFRHGVRQEPFQVLLQLLGEKHLWAKISCAERQSALGPPAYGDALPFAHAMLAVAPDRLLWGTDWPHSQRFKLGQQCDDGDLVDLVPRLLPDEASRRKVLVENPARLFGFDG